MKHHNVFVLGAVAACLLAGCATSTPGPAARASLAARSGSTVTGSVNFTEVPGGVKVEAQVAGLTPGEHGFHIHEAGDCSAPDASSAKGHFNPSGMMHGHTGSPEHHGGDMPNLVANAMGEAYYNVELPGATLKGPNSIIGRSAVVHADPDDYKSQPAGNSGKRVACGVIAAN